MQFTEEQTQVFTEEGWYSTEGEKETKDELLARAKLALQQFKEMAKSEATCGKTVFCVSHGQFLHYLFMNIMSATTDKAWLDRFLMVPHNNALTIIDFDVNEGKSYRDETILMKTVSARMVSHNLQIIHNVEQR